jgi:two-component system catabolic regulation response regulator CreB
MNPTILIVEDEDAIADTLVYALETDGCSVHRCGTESAARQFLTDHPVDLIILDIGLPDGNGFELCRHIRRTSTVPVIFLTARSEEVDRVAGLEMGGDDYVVKPFSPREMSARVRAILRRTGDRGVAPPPAGAPADNFPFHLDENRSRINYFGHVLDLSRYEYHILRTLIAHPGWIYSREKLMTMIWDEPDMSTERTVDTHVKTIRAKLRAVRGGVEAIITHRHVGYSLRDDW